MATPPTITTTSGASTIASAVAVPAIDMTRLRYVGTDPQINGVRIYPAHIRGNSGSAAAVKGFYYGGNFMRLQLFTDSPLIDFLLDHNPGGSIRFFVDGQAVAIAATPSTGDYGGYRTKLTFAGSAQRFIEVEIAKMNMQEVCISPNYNVWLPEIDPLRVITVGDSYLDNGSSYSNSYCESAGPMFLRALGISDHFLSSQGGEGYLQLPSFFAAGEFPRQHIPYDITPYSPAWIIIALGINEASKTAAAVQAEATAYYSDLVASNPNAIITVFGPWRAPSLNPSQGISDAIKAGVNAQTAAVASKQLMFIDTYAENWHQIGGRVGATSGTANSNIYIGADNLHQIQAGQDYQVRRMVDGCRRHLDTIIAANS
jgi:hypothetical protein